MTRIEEQQRRAREDIKMGNFCQSTLLRILSPDLTPLGDCETEIVFHPAHPWSLGSGMFPNTIVGVTSNLPRIPGPFLNSHSSSVEEISSSLPLPLTSTVLPSGSGGIPDNAGTTTNGQETKAEG
ncbi:hypothetical protein GYMLUDRAFT_78347 [Collybiopsis luxurians FD-317 M1]|uniref:Uncharacterized protein n=1 Tax=Collybiopsis luxurians FD-317 M1 TaxID=944289 RepID=A0A0D0C0H1_9AGAR|nr:hypothetical protein GYMLUDRAFT_78347 [Collybiopsis luxurians FD-317 M1]